MAATTVLFDQLTDQVNFLLLAQRNMILVCAFSVGLASFRKNFDFPFIKYLVIILFVYAIAVGAKSIEDFNAYIKDTKEDDPSLDPREMNLIDRYEKWVYFSYALLAIITLVLVAFAEIEFFKYLHPFIGVTNKKKIN